MARVALSLLALFISATYVAAHVAPAAAPTAAEGKLEALCSKTHDVNSCLRLLAPTVTTPAQIDSLEWYRKVLSKSLSKAIVAKSFMTKRVRGLDAKTQIALMNCVDKVSNSVELLQQVSHEFVELYKTKDSKGFTYGWHKKNVQTLMETATNQQEACYESLEGRQDAILLQVREYANNAYTANKIVSDIVLAV